MKKHLLVLCLTESCLTLVLLSSPLYADECSPFQFGLWPQIQLVPKDKVVCGVRLDLLWGDNAETWGLDAGLVNIAGASRGLQIGGVNWLDNRGGGVSWGIQATGAMNYTNKITYTGAQIALGMNLNAGSEITGLQLAAINAGGKINGIQGGFLNLLSDVNGVQLGAGNTADHMTGLQIAYFANVVEEEMNGIQLSFANLAKRHMTGVQIGLLNSGEGHLWGRRTDNSFSGVQIGLLNGAERVSGGQIGLFNMCRYLTGVQIGFINIVTGGSAVPFFPIINVGWY